jgi:hypothetical protein
VLFLALSRSRAFLISSTHSGWSLQEFFSALLGTSAALGLALGLALGVVLSAARAMLGMVLSRQRTKM